MAFHLFHFNESVDDNFRFIKNLINQLWSEYTNSIIPNSFDSFHVYGVKAVDRFLVSVLIFIQILILAFICYVL